jgi:hypothetical protein
MATLVYGRHTRGRHRRSARRTVEAAAWLVSAVARPFRAAAESGELQLLAVQAASVVLIFAVMIGASR